MNRKVLPPLPAVVVKHDDEVITSKRCITCRILRTLPSVGGKIIVTTRPEDAFH